jgi:integrase
VDRRSVVNPTQARVLLEAARTTNRSGPRLVAFFGLMYFSALQPEEAANVRQSNLTLPASGWGELHISEATPHAGADWPDDGRERDRRQLKNRARGEGRTVPVPPELTTLLREHIAEFGTGDGGHLFPEERSAELPRNTYMRAWRSARRLALTPEVAATPLGATPYTCCGTPASRRGSTAAYRRREWPSGPGTPWRCC